MGRKVGFSTTKRPNVAVDPGHGDRFIDNGRDNGQIDPGTLDPEQITNENVLALAIAGGVSDRLAEAGLEITMTRTDDVDVRPRERIEWRLEDAAQSNIFVSIHIDAAGPNASGFNVFYNGAQENSSGLAGEIAESQTIIGLRGDGDGDGREGTITDTRNLGVLNRFNNGPSVIVEVGFITNEEERNRIRNNAPAIGREIGNGIINYILNTQPVNGQQNHNQ